jgi:hypothetical protein
MRIRQASEAFQPFQRVSDKPDTGQGSERQSPDDQRRNSKRDELPVQAEDVSKAIEAFSLDQQAKENGLTLSVDGKGPGLKVILKDGSGAVIRQLTGDEFVKLRDSVVKDQKSSGKLIDQKL